MIRLFETHKVREVHELEGMWDFTPVKEDEGLPDRYSHKLLVPSCWEMHPDFVTYRGCGVYRTTITVNHRTALRLEFKGVSHTAEIYFNRKKVANHYNAYTPFSTVISDVEPGQHELVVRVDNSFSDESSLHIPNDYYTYGGIIRPVAVEYISDVFIERLKFSSKKEGDNWQAEIEVHLKNSGKKKATINLTGHLKEQTFNLESLEINAGEEKVIKQTVDFSNVLSWSSKSPNLYLLGVHLFIDGETTPSDDYIERVGFRTITTKNGKIQVNGENITIKGFNRHEDHPTVGAAIPLSLMVNDLELMKDMGANAVRTSHYPNDELFLDLCDEQGIYVWEENHARGFSLEQMQHPNFMEQCRVVNEEMVENHYNHPSIMIWGVLNECASNTEEGRTHYKMQLEQIRAMDQTRPLSFASHHREQELCFDLADIVSLNLYPQWYTKEDPGQLVDQARNWADKLGGKGKPLIMSEFGADGYYGYRSPTKVKGTEERQVEIIEKNLSAYMERDFVSGMFIWQFADCRVTEGEGWLMMRAGVQNNKGIVDQYRRPKLAYDTVKKYWHK